MGIKEQESFVPASLLKVPIAATILKMAEEKELNLDTNTTIKKEDLSNEYGNLFFHGQDNTYSLRKLLEIMIHDSDNTALNALLRHTREERIIEARLALGLPISIATHSEDTIKISPKQLSNIFRTLYYSAYLTRENSHYLLTLLTKTNFEDWLKKGIPPETIIAHKFGIYSPDKSMHDCGIVYHPKRDYLLCVMSKNTNNKEAGEIITYLSTMIYDYVDEET